MSIIIHGVSQEGCKGYSQGIPSGRYGHLEIVISVTQEVAIKYPITVQVTTTCTVSGSDAAIKGALVRAIVSCFDPSVNINNTPWLLQPRI